MDLDHVLIPLADLSRAVSEFEGRYRLMSTLADGGSGVIGVVLSTKSGEVVVGSKSQ